MGGNAGSFGIITEYTLRYEEDINHLKSFVVPHGRIYDEDLFRKNLANFAKWSNMIGTP